MEDITINALGIVNDDSYFDDPDVIIDTDESDEEDVIIE